MGRLLLVEIRLLDDNQHFGIKNRLAVLLNNVLHKMNIMQKAQPKIFVVEDNPVFQTLVLKQLENISQDIHVFSTGEKFLAELNHCPDLIILDYNLDGPINGYDVLKELKKLTVASPVIFFSSNLELSVTSSILKLGVVEYIEKTIFTLPRLKNTITRVLEASMGIIFAQA
ncbi:MAG: response regulator [Chitinophagaceae bacterium]